MKTIEITEAMRERVVAFTLALHYATCQTTEEMARFFRQSADLHNRELGRMLRMALRDDEELNARIEKLPNTREALELIVSAWDELTKPTVFASEDPCAE